MQNAYEKLSSLSKRVALYSSISNTLGWDQETKMPKEAISLRSKQQEILASLMHKEHTSAEYAKTLGSLIDLETGQILAENLQDAQKAALREWRRDYLLAVKLPSDFVEEFARVTSAAIHLWQEAKPNNDFQAFQPYLEKIVSLNRKKADLLGYENHPYDALVDSFEPEMRTDTLISLFERLKNPLSNLVKKIQTKKNPDASFLTQTYPHDQQFSFAKQLLEDMGFKNTFSRLDESAHPMCIPIHPKDMRMTTHIHLHNVISSILSTAHEGGHGLYHIHLPVEHFGTPLCEPASLSIDESQSRTWETLIGRSLSFWQYYFPKLQKIFPIQLKDVSVDAFYKAMNIVEPSMIRIESDEVSYNLHIMLRFELEKALIEEKLKASEIPEAWNEKMQEYLGLTPKTDSEGCLQDIHWAMGAIGYFPTYALGNLYAGQFFETFISDFPDWKDRVAKGQLDFISGWQKEKIHRFGRIYRPNDLCKKITGKPLQEKGYLHHLENKYASIYNL